MLDIIDNTASSLQNHVGKHVDFDSLKGIEIEQSELLGQAPHE